MDNYKKQATDFLKKTEVKMIVEFIGYKKYFSGDTDKRDVYKITFNRGDRSFSLDFGNSLNDSGLKVVNKNNGKLGFVIPTDVYKELIKKGRKSIRSKLNWQSIFSLPYRIESCDELVEPKEPTAYDVLACLQKYNVGTFEDFCADFGYDTDSRNAEKIYKAVEKEFSNVQRIWNDTEIEELQEIN